jgi:small subunit ribosomal protein S8e
MGISRDSRHKRRATGGKRNVHKKKRQYEGGRPPAMTKLGAARVHEVRVRGGNTKFRAMRLDTGSFSWGSEGEFSLAHTPCNTCLYFLSFVCSCLSQNSYP